MESNHRANLTEITGEFDHQIEALTEQVSVLKAMLGQYVTRDELQSTLLSSITNQLTTRLNEIDTAGEQRHTEFTRQYEQRLAEMATKDEVAGVIASSGENAQRLTKLEATSDTRLLALEKRADQTEEKTLKLDASIKDIRGDTEKIVESAEKMRVAFVDFLSSDEKQQKETDREIDSLKISEAHTVNDIRELQQQVNRHHQTIGDQKTWIVQTLTPMELVIMGDKESGTAGIAAEIKDVKTRQLALDNGLSTFTKFINNPLGRGIILVLMAGNFISFIAQVIGQH